VIAGWAPVDGAESRPVPKKPQKPRVKGAGRWASSSSSALSSNMGARQRGNAMAAAGLALCTLCGLVGMRRHSVETASALESDVSARVKNGVPIFDWSDTHNVNMFMKACADGNDMACKELAGNGQALDNLNAQAKANERWGGVHFWPKNDENTFQHWGDTAVPLDGQYEYGELQGQVCGGVVLHWRTLSPDHSAVLR